MSNNTEVTGLLELRKKTTTGERTSGVLGMEGEVGIGCRMCSKPQRKHEGLRRE
jgi:hypothetical protein